MIQIISNSSAKIYHDNERSKKETLTILNMEVIHYYYEGYNFYMWSNNGFSYTLNSGEDHLTNIKIIENIR